MSAFLTELEFAVKHLPPTIPEAQKQAIETILSELKSLGPKATDDAVRDAMIEIGRIEWPYRHAYMSMINVCCSHTEHDLFLKALSDKTRKKYLSIGGADATLKEMMRSQLFEEKLTPEQRQEVQTAALDAKFQMEDVMKAYIEQQPEQFKDLVVKAQEEQNKLEKAIERLQALISVDAHWGPEIQARVDQMQLGWSIAEPDVAVADVEKEIEYWQGMLAGGA